jgi:peptidoglycan/LPS O-acetylase OafA/YrhL
MPRLQGRGTLRQTALAGQMAVVCWVRRYLRLTPAFAVVLAVFTTLTPLLESAPPSPTGLGHEVSLCRRYWWQNVLYVNNFLAPSAYDMCYIPCE